LVKAIETLQNDTLDCAAALYTCAKTVVLVGVLEGQLFAIDTHARVVNTKDEKMGCLAVFYKHVDEVEHLCSWLQEGLKERGVRDNELQSFAIMR